MPIYFRIMLHLYLCCAKGNITHKSATEFKGEINSYVLLDLPRNLKHIFKTLNISYYSLTRFSGHFSLEKRYESQVTTQFLNEG